MFGKSCFILLWLLAILGCAEPKYEKIAPSDGNSVQSQKVSSCNAKLNLVGYCILWEWEIKPTSSKAGSLAFKIVRSNLLDDSPVPVDVDFKPEVVLWMGSMGHGSTPTTVQRIDVGSFRTSNVFFIMPGEWQIKFQLKEGETIKDEAVVNITI